MLQHKPSTIQLCRLLIHVQVAHVHGTSYACMYVLSDSLPPEAHWVGIEEEHWSSQDATQELGMEHRGCPYPSLRVEEGSEKCKHLRRQREINFGVKVHTFNRRNHMPFYSVKPLVSLFFRPYKFTMNMYDESRIALDFILASEIFDRSVINPLDLRPSLGQK